MKSIFNKLIAGLIVLAAVVAYPVVSVGKTEDSKRIVLNEDNTVNLNGEINSESVAAAIQALQKLDNNSKKPIYLFMYTPGGGIQEGLELIEAAKGMNRPVETVTMFSASMGFQTVQALGKRLIVKNGVLMSHRAAGGFQGSFGGQSPSQLDSRYNFWLQRIKELDEQTVERSHGKQTMASYLDLYKNEAWFTGTQAVEKGFADAIVTVHCDKSLDGTVPKSINFLGMLITYELSKCPLVTAPLNIRISNKNKQEIDPRLAEDIISKFIEKSNLQGLLK